MDDPTRYGARAEHHGYQVRPQENGSGSAQDSGNMPYPSTTSYFALHGHNYAPPTINEQGTAHLGDTHVGGIYTQHTASNIHYGNLINHGTVNHFGSQVDETQRSKVADWLASGSYQGHQNDIYRNVLPGTGQWLLVHPAFERWKKEGKQNLALVGGPGVGKTHLMAIVVNELLHRTDACADQLVLFFFNSFTRRQEQSLQNMLEQLLRQAFEAGKNSTYVQQLFEKHHKRGQSSRPSQQELFDGLQKTLMCYSHVFVCIDALDECSSDDKPAFSARKGFLRQLVALQQESASDISILVTTRPNQENIPIVDDWPNIPIRAHRKDLEAYISGRW